MPDVRESPEPGPSRSAYKTSLPSSELHYSFILDCPIINAEFHPQTSRVLLITSTVNEVVLVRLREKAAEDPVSNQIPGDDTVDSTTSANRPRKRRKVSRGHEVLYLQPHSKEEALQFARETAKSSQSQATADQDEDTSEKVQEEATFEALHEIEMSLFDEAPSSKESAW